jgi:uncharacterized repeat protein (TIGR01451 family)
MKNSQHEIRAVLMGATTLLIFGALQPGQSAPQAGDVVPTLKAFKVTLKNGVDELEPGDAIRPGDTLEYRVVYRNNGARAVKDVQATLPIPAQLEFVPASARPAVMQASTDGRVFATPPLRRRVNTPSGVKIVTVPVSEYRYLRWNIGVLPAGSSVSVAARATLPR